MNQNELTKTVMMISNWNTFCFFMAYIKYFSAVRARGPFTLLQTLLSVTQQTWEVGPTLGQRLKFAGCEWNISNESSEHQQTWEVGPTLVYCWANIKKRRIIQNVPCGVQMWVTRGLTL